MSQLVLLIISFCYGLIVGLFNWLLNDKKILKVLNFIFMTLIYCVMFYFINDGEIHLYNKFVLILGFCCYYFFISVKLNVKLKRNCSKK